MPERIHLKRVYDPPSDDDGERIFVERLWPRGITRERAAIDFWPKEVAPSQDLRRWYGHDTAKWEEFRRRYEAELKDNSELVGELEDRARKGTITLLFASRDREHCSARVLKEHLERRLRSKLNMENDG